ncbi:hypothetical protein Pan189_40950 [Stratiformator vulcanicus]|uniref:Uncharacterized protein n=2 Tax=Stratiformator vulcanicus TaxID=2527980 RepID=A0A517R715_9PLAN|nr:hypothetical protein Pan189_40950 [Stratiformator vulcanicus]
MQSRPDQWNRVAWFGMLTGSTSWMFILGGAHIALSQLVRAGLVIWIGVFLLLIGWGLWARRARTRLLVATDRFNVLYVLSLLAILAVIYDAPVIGNALWRPVAIVGSIFTMLAVLAHYRIAAAERASMANSTDAGNVDR